MFSRSIRRALFTLSTTALLFGAATPVALAQNEAPDIQVSARFDKKSYGENEPVQIEVTVKNVGTATGKAKADPRSDSNFYHDDWHQWGALAPVEQGKELKPGETHVVKLTGRPNDSFQPKVTFRGIIRAEGDRDESNNAFDISADIGGRGDLDLTIYGDGNGNDRFDSGEALADARVRLWGIGLPFEKQTDARGKVDFQGVRSGTYKFEVHAPRGWQAIVASTLLVKENDRTSLVIGTKRESIPAQPAASIKFDRPSFKAGERVGLTVTVTNKAKSPQLINADCLGFDVVEHAVGNGDEWGDFRRGGPGVTFAGGETRSFHIEQAMPKAAADHGYVLADCAFVTEPGHPNPPRVNATAKVPGAFANPAAKVVHAHGSQEDPVRNVPVVLVDPDTNKVVARASTDQGGNVSFRNVPVGLYRPVVVGPWRVVPSWEGQLFAAVRGAKWPEIVNVVPGPQVADPEGRAPGGAGRDLASTGADPVGLAAFGGLLLVSGAGAVAAARRKVTS